MDTTYNTKLKRIIIHWTAGIHVPNSHELECYHFLVDSLGNVHKGKFKPEDNIDCTDKKYAQHTGGGNTGSIGVSLCGMANFRDKNNVGCYPVTRVQFEAAMKLCAELINKYKISITTDTVLTHYEFGKKHPETTSFGKPDISFLPPFPWLSKDDIGKFIRSKIKWYTDRLNVV